MRRILLAAALLIGCQDPGEVLPCSFSGDMAEPVSDATISDDAALYPADMTPVPDAGPRSIPKRARAYSWDEVSQVWGIQFGTLCAPKEGIEGVVDWFCKKRMFTWGLPGEPKTARTCMEDGRTMDFYTTVVCLD